MVFDLHREMKIEYTQTTNLPKIIGWRQGTIENHYTFDGQKLGKKVYDYRGNLTLNERYFDELKVLRRKNFYSVSLKYHSYTLIFQCYSLILLHGNLT